MESVRTHGHRLERFWLTSPSEIKFPLYTVACDKVILKNGVHNGQHAGENLFGYPDALPVASGVLQRLASLSLGFDADAVAEARTVPDDDMECPLGSFLVVHSVSLLCL